MTNPKADPLRERPHEAPEWLWYGEVDGVDVVTFGRWPKRGSKWRYKLAEIQPTEHDQGHPKTARQAFEDTAAPGERCEPVDISGWKLVPDDPTEEMWQAGRSADIHPGDSYSKVWRAMFNAAPSVDDCEATSAPVSHEISTPPVVAGADRAWQPIETAPRDGSPILCWCPDDEFKPITGIDLIWWEGSLRGGWTKDGDHPVNFLNKPTHWMPLPRPPLVDAGKVGEGK